jgi:hypothetical protein
LRVPYTKKLRGCLCDIHRKATLDSLIDVAEEFIERLTLSTTAWNGGYFSPVAIFLRFMNDYF